MKRSMHVQSCHRLEIRASEPLHTRETGSKAKKHYQKVRTLLIDKEGNVFQEKTISSLIKLEMRLGQRERCGIASSRTKVKSNDGEYKS